MPLELEQSRSILPGLAIPIICAPMAGGPSTPQLAAAASNAGGLGFLGAGYLDPAATAALLDATRELTVHPFGVNIFVPSSDPVDHAAVAAYRERLLPAAEAAGVALPEAGSADPAHPDDDFYDEKIDLAIDREVPLVSFTFGLPSAQVVAKLHDAGIAVVASVASVSAVSSADALGVDAIVVQGPEAGGHRATLSNHEKPEHVPLADLLLWAAEATTAPLIAAGGVSRGSHIAELLASGASAVQLGTAFLRAEEAGTRPAHRAALTDPRFVETSVTNAFSGRPARGLRNAFMDAHSSHAPGEYPQVHWLTSPLRAAAAKRGDAESISLWAGVGYPETKSGPAAAILSALWEDALAARAEHGGS
ncbi:2-nitropropane dioxygenase NPD [Segniliparus rotundus DSM 44985]|uniref:Propionate 3-nitronate monooxygenase n=1 Tax=Segniliparus rotundus (strain ATCC BAA-972 / CDC 1076 / CIP 108378 / DSM 44985 / JCM 13578) TaxID=640132 RepID=D6ZA87_SEGRD|nr:nitronate monooxygenase [Segniliparus rotundus]ADG96629.1 2-nitropropane dioxygenase NPD [Segniliparus rotundus DSM 44985]